jgi:hypothetical protein
MEKLPELTEENFLQAMRRDYGRLAAWVTRLNRMAEPARPAEKARATECSRMPEPSRVMEPSRAG